MLEKSIKEIEAKVKELWQEDYATYKKPKIEITKDQTRVYIKLSRMYEPPGLKFEQLKALSEFFETEDINDDDRFSDSGCETCDYGSSYGFTLRVGK